MPKSLKEDREEKLEAIGLILTEVCKMLDDKIEHSKVKSYLMLKVFLIGVGRADDVIRDLKEEVEYDR